MTIPPPDGAALRALVELGEKATPGPYRAHDHNGMAKVGEKPADWVGYAWVGRVTKNSNPDGTFDAGWANMDRREDGHKEYRERASVDAHFVAAACNFVRDALPALLEALSETTRERDEARARVINSPETADFMEGVPIEAAHQRERWGVDHDAGKSPFDWFWLIGFLSQKAADAAVRGDVEKAKHHTISTAAALANWHAVLSGKDSRFQPGITPKPAEMTV